MCYFPILRPSVGGLTTASAKRQRAARVPRCFAARPRRPLQTYESVDVDYGQITMDDNPVQVAVRYSVEGLSGVSIKVNKAEALVGPQHHELLRIAGGSKSPVKNSSRGELPPRPHVLFGGCFFSVV